MNVNYYIMSGSLLAAGVVILDSSKAVEESDRMFDALIGSG